MRVQFVLALGAMIAFTSTAATAQNQVAPSENQVASATDQKAQTKRTKPAEKKADGELICKRLSQGKVCLTAEKWKAYQEQF